MIGSFDSRSLLVWMFWGWLFNVLKLRGVSGLQSLGLLFLLLVATTVCGVSHGVHYDNLSNQESGAAGQQIPHQPSYCFLCMEGYLFLFCSAWSLNIASALLYHNKRQRRSFHCLQATSSPSSLTLPQVQFSVKNHSQGQHCINDFFLPSQQAVAFNTKQAE